MLKKMVLLTSLLALFGIVQTPWAKKKISHKFTQILAKKTGLPLTVDSLTGFFPFFFAAHVKADHLPFSYENAHIVTKGTMVIDCVAHGSIIKPKIEGTIRLRDGYFESIKTGMVIENIEATLMGKKNHFVLHELIGDHIASARGELKLNSTLPFFLGIQLNNAPLYTLDPLTAKGDGSISLSGNLKKINLEGEMTLSQGCFAIPEKLKLPQPKLEVTYTGGGGEEEKPLPHEPFPCHIDLSIGIPQHFIIKGRGMHSNWKGGLSIKGEADHLVYSGSLHAIEGQCKIVGKIFDMTSGKIEIGGLQADRIDLNIKGAMELPPISVIARVTGKASQPNFYVTSNPPLETTEILSRILFNQSLDELTPLQACRLIQLIAEAGGATPDVLESIKERFGIDVLDLAKSSFNEQDLAVKIGKYLSKGVFVGFSKSLANETGSLLFQSRLFRNLFFSAYYGTTLEGERQGKFSLKWYKSF